MKKTKAPAKKTPVPAKAGKTAAKAKPAAKKPAPKAKPAGKAVKAKVEPKKAAKESAKSAPIKAAAATKSAAAKTAKAVPTKKAPAPAPAAKGKVAPASVKAETKKPETKAEAKAKAAKESAKPAPVVDAFPALEPGVKRPSKPFFLEVKPGVERVIKRGDKSAATQAIDLQARRKGPTAEESPEELAERIERELQSQSFLKRAPMRRQLCTKCGINAVSPRFTIDRELGYCDSCAEILRLGETKEAKRMEFGLSPVKKDEAATGEPAGPDEVPPEDAEEEPVPDEDLDE